MAAQQGERSKVAMPNDIAYSRKLGPLTPLVGEWEGDVGVDLSYHNKDDWTTETTYFEKASFKPIPLRENGQQTLWGLTYSMTDRQSVVSGKSESVRVVIGGSRHIKNKNKSDIKYIKTNLTIHKHKNR